MATTATATLNGGPRGGLHATTLIHSEESQQEETCRVDSNSSFDSGHEDTSAMPPLGLEDVSGWSGYKSSFYLDSQLSSVEGSAGKKRRKQSRPVRIPASEHMDDPRGAPDQPGLPPNTGVPDHSKDAGADHDLEECDNGSELEGDEESKHEDENSLPSKLQPKSGRQVPLNLSSKNQGDDSSTDYDHPTAGGGQMDPISSSSHLTQLQLNSLMDNDKTELPGQGTKDSNRNSTPSFSSGLFPLISSSPFFSFFPQGQQPGHMGQQHLPNYQQLAASTTPNPPSGTPSSSSSVGSGHPHPHNNNNNNNNNSLSSSNNNLAPGNLSNIPPQRIFNPEAYCDLCNKEFCNKYFLKTHKANKHGVYSETPTSSSLPPSQVMAAAAAALSISSSPSTPFLSSASSLLVPSTKTPTSSQPLQPSSSSSFSPFNLKPTAPDTSVLSKSLAMSLEAKGSGSNSNGSAARESFCDLCQKEFCNKYFLKRHKAKIHGIPMESNGGSRSSKSLQHPRQNFSNGLNDTGLPLMMGSDLESLGLELVNKHIEEAGGIEEGEVGRGEGRRSGEIRGSGEDPGQLEHNSAGREGEEEMREDHENSSPFKLSSLQQLKLPLGLPQLGTVSTNETTCQFCFREFASKSLLRSHMTKKHRLLLPTFPPFLLPFQGIGGGLFEESAEGGGDTGEQFYTAEGLQTKEEVDYECNQCGRSFQTIYLLRMHKSYFHPESDDMSDITAAAAAAVTKMEEGSDVESGKDTPNPPDPDNNKTKGEEEEEPETEGTSDSDDLRRLQTMIMELNRVSSAAASSSWSPPPECPPSASPANAPSGNSASVCHVCSKEFYSSYFLQQHIQHFHSNPEVIKTESPEVPPKNQIFDRREEDRSKKMNEIYDSSKGKMNDLFDSSKKMNELFENSSSPGQSKEKMGKEQPLGGLEVSALSLTAGSSSFLTPGPKSISGSTSKGEASGKRPSPSLSRSYCTICHKELCNKYFMRTHMLKMHGISIESSTGLGGVTCDICNKELCSKYFLKVHKQNTHGIVEDGPSPPNPSTPGPIGLPLVSSSPQEPSTQSLATTQADLVPLLASTPVEVQNRYFCHYSEVCPFCGRRFRSAKWLKTHLMSDHGQEGKDKWKSIEKSLQQQQQHPRRQSKSGSSSMSLSSSSRSSQKPKSGQKTGLPLTSNGSNGNKCALCGYQTQDVEVMKVHLIKEHASQLTGGDGTAAALQYQDPGRVVLDPLTLLFQKMEGGTSKLYRCAYCPFTTSLLVYLYAHERTHTGLANSMTPQPAQSTSTGSSEPSNTFQCPMCFHTFHHLETFQQHLIGHQMSGVLAPFFTPATSSGGRMPFESPPSGEAPAFPALSLLNGNTPESLYLSLKSAEQEEGEREHRSEKVGKEPEGEGVEMRTGVQERKGSGRVRVGSEDEELEGQRRKGGKVKSYRCSYCERSFRSRLDCFTHIHQTHSRKRSTYFRCRKCKFQCSQYQKLVVHNRVHHTLFRGQHSGRVGGGGMRWTKLREEEEIPGGGLEGGREWMNVEGLPQGRAIPQQGVLGEYLMQGFLLSCSNEDGKREERGHGEERPSRGGHEVTSTEDQVVEETFSHNNNHNCANKYESGLFVPSLVYLPVREKVSQSVRVSFSLTPTS